ncbi:MAG: hypothetical protein HZA17_06350 [Nitrospirae bacterium]|nr:hypothetical protein [Nitrospirota bacterium]
MSGNIGCFEKYGERAATGFMEPESAKREIESWDDHARQGKEEWKENQGPAAED